MKRLVMTITVSAVLALGVRAQSFNIDIGGNPVMGAPFGVPESTFGAAAERPGVWNLIGAISSKPVALVNLEGQSTLVSCARSDQIGRLFMYANPNATGNFESLMCDGDCAGMVGVTHSYTITGLAPATYTVFTYAWSPFDPNNRTLIDIPNSINPNPQIVGGALAGTDTFTLGVTHAMHVIKVAPGGVLTINFTGSTGVGIVNGFQITDGFGLSLAQTASTGALTIANSLGIAGDYYANFFTLFQGAYPHGPIFGLDMTVQEAVYEVAVGRPFFGTLDAFGCASFVMPGPIPPGMTLYCVSLELDPAMTLRRVTAPFTYVTL